MNIQPGFENLTPTRKVLSLVYPRLARSAWIGITRFSVENEASWREEGHLENSVWCSCRSFKMVCTANFSLNLHQHYSEGQTLLPLLSLCRVSLDLVSLPS